MSLKGHLEALERKHAELEDQIGAEERQTSPDDTKLSHLKRRKLAIKDQITAIKSQLDIN